MEESTGGVILKYYHHTWIQETHETRPDTDLNLGPPEYVTTVLTTRPRGWKNTTVYLVWQLCQGIDYIKSNARPHVQPVIDSPAYIQIMFSYALAALA
jgi:hypothetical protein